MRYLSTAAMLAAMAAAAFAQDPNRNRMNDQYPAAGQQLEVECLAAQAFVFSPVANRMNVQYQAGSSAELSGGPNPNGNRMNFRWLKAQPKAQPKEVERLPIDLTPSP